MRGENKSVVETLVLNSDFVLCNPLAGRDAPDREINLPGEGKTCLLQAHHISRIARTPQKHLYASLRWVLPDGEILAALGGPPGWPDVYTHRRTARDPP
jgi:hypothetical protein